MAEEGPERMLEQEDKKGCYEMMASRYIIAVTYRALDRLWLPTENQASQMCFET